MHTASQCHLTGLYKAYTGWKEAVHITGQLLTKRYNMIIHSVCKQTATEHTHYEIVLVRPSKFATTLNVLRTLANKVGGQTAGQVVTHLLEKPDPSLYGVDYIKVVRVPAYQICSKETSAAPSLDWERWLFVTPNPDETTPVNNNVYVKHISH